MRTQSSGLAIQQVYYFKYLLFVPIWFAPQVIKMLRIKRASEADAGDWTKEKARLRQSVYGATQFGP